MNKEERRNGSTSEYVFDKSSIAYSGAEPGYGYIEKNERSTIRTIHPCFNKVKCHSFKLKDAQRQRFHFVLSKAKGMFIKMTNTIRKKATYKLTSLTYDVCPAGTMESTFQSLNTAGKIAYQQVELSGNGVSGPINVILIGNYVQNDEYDEVDLELVYADIPDGSTAEVKCSNNTFSIAMRDISGSGLSGKEVKKAGKIDTSFTLTVVIKDVSALKNTSLITIKLQNIESSIKGPVNKVLLGQAQLKFDQFA